MKMTRWSGRFLVVLALGAANFDSQGDQVVMQNGDRYNGKVLSLSATNLSLQSEVLGVVNLPRSQVASVSMGSPAATNLIAPRSLAPTNSATDLSAAIRQLGTQSNLVNQVRAQFLASASPEVNQQFDRMLNDLGTGKMSIADLRAQAKSAAGQLREFEKEAGEDLSGTLSVYLSILDGFLAETESSTPSVTNKPARKKP